MTSPPPGAGRRGNGLTASDWGALVDLDPRLAESLLDRLAAAQVPAYVEPAGAADTYARATLPNRPLDRLFVDPTLAQQARDVVAAEVAELVALLAEDPEGGSTDGLVQPVPRFAARRVLSPPPLPGLASPAPPATPTGATPPAPDEAPPAAGAAPAPDEDELFRQIVAGWDSPAQDPVPRWPVPEDNDGTPPAPPAPAPPARPRPSQPGLPDWVEPEALDREDRDLDPGGYEPPPPPPAPTVAPRTVGALVVLLLGLVLVFAPEAVGQSASPGIILLGTALLLGGAAGLVFRLRDDPNRDDGPDDGAVV